MNERVAVDREGRPMTDAEGRPATNPEPRRAVNPDRPTAPDRPVTDDRPMSLFHDEEDRGFKTRWDGIQTGFVDQPKAAVEQADALVVEMLKRLTDGFGAERAKLESQWSRGQDVSTEDLRIALKRYRSFFERLLSI
jgi:hypothetical protein